LHEYKLRIPCPLRKEKGKLEHPYRTKRPQATKDAISLNQRDLFQSAFSTGGLGADTVHHFNGMHHREQKGFADLSTNEA